MSCILFQIIFFIVPTACQSQKVELPPQLEKAFLTLMYTYLPLFQKRLQETVYRLEIMKF